MRKIKKRFRRLLTNLGQLWLPSRDRVHYFQPSSIKTSSLPIVGVEEVDGVEEIAGVT